VAINLISPTVTDASGFAVSKDVGRETKATNLASYPSAAGRRGRGRVSGDLTMERFLEAQQRRRSRFDEAQATRRRIFDAGMNERQRAFESIQSKESTRQAMFEKEQKNRRNVAVDKETERMRKFVESKRERRTQFLNGRTHGQNNFSGKCLIERRSSPRRRSSGRETFTSSRRNWRRNGSLKKMHDRKGSSGGRKGFGWR